MYEYEELLRLSGLCEKKGEKEQFYKRWKKLSESLLEDGEKESTKTCLREDKAKPSLENEKAVKNAKATKDGFIKVSEGYYEG